MFFDMSLFLKTTGVQGLFSRWETRPFTLTKVSSINLRNGGTLDFKRHVISPKALEIV